MRGHYGVVKPNEKIVAFYLPAKFLIRAEQAAAEVDKKVTIWARDEIVRLLKSKYKRKWADEWSEMDEMDREEAMRRWEKLRQGRPLPDGFAKWTRSQRSEWLDKEWPLYE